MKSVWDGGMKEDVRGDATDSQHRPVAASLRLLMMNSCRVDGKNERHTHCHPLLFSPAAACDVSSASLNEEQRAEDGRRPFRDPLTSMKKSLKDECHQLTLFWGLVLRFSGFSQQRVDRLRMAVAAM